MSDNKAEFRKMRRLVSLDEAKNVIDNKQISEALIANGIIKLADKDELLILHDGSDIRKPYATDLESIGKVRALNGDIINGYHSFNSVAVDLHGRLVTPIATEIYSNREENFVSQKNLKLISKPLSKKANEADKLHYEAIKAQVSSQKHLNSTLVAKHQIEWVSKQLKKDNPLKKLTHVIDRGSDDNELFTFISQLNDQFVIRLKSSRLSSDGDKLVNKSFKHKKIRHFDKIQIKNKVYQNASCVIEYGELLNGHSVVRVQLLNREGKALFKVPMLLITNKEVNTPDQASIVYSVYLKRSKIEGVFKFLKNVLGWEESQIREFSAIKTLLTFCYFVAGYFYEIESALIHNETIQFLAHLGNGKGKVTRFYILRGLNKWINKTIVDEAIKEFNITPEQMEEIAKLAMMGI
jgi:Transposase DDE domain